MKQKNTIERCLEILAGFDDVCNVDRNQIKSSDINLIQSLGRQVLRGIPLTDRQYDLAVVKCNDYYDLLFKFGMDKTVFENLRLPLREIDRSKWVRKVEHKGENCLGVRFTFNKKLIELLEKTRTKEKAYDRELKIHYFPYNEQSIFTVMQLLEGKHFEVEESIQNVYKELLLMKNNKKDHVPGIYGLKLRNFSSKAIDVMIEDIGEPTKKNLPIFADRKNIYGVGHIDEDDLNESGQGLNVLTNKIIRRTNTQIFVNKSTYNYNMLAETLLELFRYPILVVCNDKFKLNDIHPFYETFKGVFQEDSFSVLFREENDTAEGQEINNYIKDKKLNSPLDTTSKLVYIKGDKIPKPLLVNEWRPRAVVLSGSKMSNGKLRTYLNDCDLIIHYDTDISPFHRDVEKI
tara:strand:- start:4757 stop:5968 length:1212 start_codon:yes stop_codon:yes gene_type:complete